MGTRLLSGPYCKKDKEYISEELWSLWIECFEKIGAVILTSHTIYFHISDEVYYNQGGPPPPMNEDILCIIHYPNNEVCYYLQFEAYETIKDYICALKNISFL